MPPMDCCDFKRKLFEEPRSKAADFLAHASDCAQCQPEYHKAQALESLIEAALQLAPSEQLEQKILYSSRSAPRHIRRNWVIGASLAASLLLTVGLLETSSRGIIDQGLPLSETLISHTRHVSLDLRSDVRIDNKQLQQLFASLGAEMLDDLGEVRYASLCQIRNRLGLHIIISGRLGPITLLFMPGESIDSDIQFHTQEFRGAILPNQAGSLAVLSQSNAQVHDIAKQLNPRVHWQI